MPELPKFVRVPTLKSVEEFRKHADSLGVELPCDEAILRGPDSPLAQAVAGVTMGGKRIGNRWVIQPMEGWDGTTRGGVTDDMIRRWRRFGESGAKVIYGGEAMAVRPDGRANPNQLILNEENKAGIAKLRETLVAAHQERHQGTGDLVIGFQLTHSGRFCRPNDKQRWESRVAFRHPILDRRFGVTRDEQVLSDDEVEVLIEDYVRAARLAWEVGADFVDLKHCHGYLLHEFLGAHTRPGRFGGSFENRTRILGEIVGRMRAGGNPIDVAVRLSAFDLVPFRPDPSWARPGDLGPGVPEDFSGCLPYRYGFGVDAANPTEYDLGETHEFLRLCGRLGVRMVNLTAGSPYYNPHIQRPAAYPPSDGYRPAWDPLVDVARQIEVVRRLRERAPAGMVLIGSGYSYLQEYLPQVAQAVVRRGWADLIGIGRMVLSYPGIVTDSLTEGKLAPKWICRTFSDCTTAPRNGLISGCYPLDKYYSSKPEFERLKAVKRDGGAR